VSFKGTIDSVESAGGKFTIETTVSEGPSTVRAPHSTTTINEKVKLVELIGEGARLTTISNEKHAVNLASTGPDTDSLPPVVPPHKRRFTPEQAADIREELERMRDDSGDVAVSLLRDGLMERAESLAGRYMKMHATELPANVRRYLRRVVGSVIQASPRHRQVDPGNASRDRVGSTIRPETDEGDPPYRCECVYCHALHPPGTCSLSPERPMVPVVASPILTSASGVALYPNRSRHGYIYAPGTWSAGRR
jgi:hypothetical protein